MTQLLPEVDRNPMTRSRISSRSGTRLRSTVRDAFAWTGRDWRLWAGWSLAGSVVEVVLLLVLTAPYQPWAGLRNPNPLDPVRVATQPTSTGTAQPTPPTWARPATPRVATPPTPPPAVVLTVPDGPETAPSSPLSPSQPVPNPSVTPQPSATPTAPLTPTSPTQPTPAPQPTPDPPGSPPASAPPQPSTATRPG